MTAPAEDVENVIKKCKSYWIANPPNGEDPTPWDYLHLAGTFLSDCHIKLEVMKLSESQIEQILTLYEDKIAEKNAPENERQLSIRDRSVQKLSSQLKSFVHEVRRLNLELGSDIDIITKATFMYYAFLRLAKECRESDRFGNPIDNSERLLSYSDLANQSRSNPWIRAGIIMVRKRRINKGFCDKWIPRETVYWEEF